MPERAVRAALELVDAVRALGPEVQARAGVLTGEAAVTLGVARPGHGRRRPRQHRVAPAVRRRAGHGPRRRGDAPRGGRARSPSRPPASTVLKGKDAPVAAWRALRVVAERGGRGRADRLEAPFVGRDAELRLLKDLFHATVARAVARGSSRSPARPASARRRLAWELLKYLDGLVEGVWWHDGRSPAYGEGITFWALGEMVRAPARPGRDRRRRDDHARTRSSTTLAEHVPDEAERRWIEPALLALLGVGEAPAGGRDELFAAWRTFFERIAATGHVVARLRGPPLGGRRACSTSSTTCSSGAAASRS